MPSRKWAVQRIAGALAFEDRHELFSVLLEAAENSIGEIAVHLDVSFPRKGERVRRFGGAGVAEQAAKDVGEEIGKALSISHLRFVAEPAECVSKDAPGSGPCSRSAFEAAGRSESR